MEPQESSSGLLIGVIIGGTLLAFLVFGGIVGFSFMTHRANAPVAAPPDVAIKEVAPIPEPLQAQPMPPGAPAKVPPDVEDIPLSPNAIKEELQKLQGNWKLESREINGEAAPGKDEKNELSFQGEAWSWKRRGPWPLRKTFFELTKSGTLRFAALGAGPRALDLATTKEISKIDDPPPGVENPQVKHADTTLLVIYGVVGDTLHLCYGSGTRRPHEFRTNEGDGFTYTVWKRDTAKSTPAKSEAKPSEQVK